MKIFINIGFLFWMLFSPALGQISIESNVDKAEITIGDKVTYEIKVSYEKDGVIELPSALGNLGQFEVKDYSQSDPVKNEKGFSQTWTFLISTFTVGEYMIPPQIVEYTASGDTAKQTLYSDPIKIVVNRTTSETVKDIADIDDIVGLPGSNKILGIILIPIICLGLFFLIFWLAKRKKQQQRAVKPRPPPYEEAKEFLQELAKDDLISQEREKEFCFRLSEILRTYISRRYTIDALESTTEEFIVKIEDITITRAQKDNLNQFCVESDPVKFANLKLNSDEGKQIYGLVKTFVEETKPREINEGEKK